MEIGYDRVPNDIQQYSAYRGIIECTTVLYYIEKILMEFLHGWGLEERGVMRDGYLGTVVCSVCTYGI